MEKSIHIKATLLLTSIMTVMAGALISPSLPAISKFFGHYENSEILSKLILTLPALFIAILAPLAGYIIDRFGRLNVLIFSLILFSLGGTSGLYLDNPFLILAGRALLGLSVAGSMTAATTLIGDYYFGNERMKFLGWQSAVMAFGGTVFLILGGYLADINWRLPFSIYFFSLLLLPPVIIFLKEPEKKQEIGDSIEALGAKLPWNRIIPAYALVFFGMMVFYMIIVQIPFLMAKIDGVNNFMTGFAIAISTFFIAVGSTLYSRFRKVLDFYPMFAFSFLVTGTGYGIIAMSSGFWFITSGMVIGGFGLGFMMPNSNNRIIEIAPLKKRGSLVGLLTMAVFLGQFSSPVFIEPLNSLFSVNKSFAIIASCLGATGLYLASKDKIKDFVFSFSKNN